MFFYAFFGYLVVFLLKIIFNRPRPYEELQVFSTIQKFEKSFPSSHAFLSALLINFVPNENWKKYFIFYTILVSISLIISGVHYLSDVLVGALLGFIFPRYILPEKKLENIKILK
ncbi:MAG: phosphatase PAP2 family protein [Candidatus Aenigmatarchaeota archaeon]